jgi:hypothetical protein
MQLCQVIERNERVVSPAPVSHTDYAVTGRIDWKANRRDKHEAAVLAHDTTDERFIRYRASNRGADTDALSSQTPVLSRRPL